MIKFHVRAAPWFNAYEIHMRQKLGDTYGIAQPVLLKAYKPEEGAMEFPDPMLRLEPDAVQELMDSLWHAGIRPTEGRGSAGSLAATEKHLEDMRHLVSHHLGLVFPK